LFPPTPSNNIELANETTVTAPLRRYQYVPAETVEPSNDRSLESCAAHVIFFQLWTINPEMINPLIIGGVGG
ncbi:hypothetical protein BGY98DRAFT_919953, partial [Russula aff. rugulosa BPL654]